MSEKTGLAAIVLREDDKLIEVKITDDEQDVILVTKYGMCIRFSEKDVRPTGRVFYGSAWHEPLEIMMK